MPGFPVDGHKYGYTSVKLCFKVVVFFNLSYLSYASLLEI